MEDAVPAVGAHAALRDMRRVHPSMAAMPRKVPMPTMIDLFSGSGSASYPMVERGWRVLRVDLAPQTPDAITADVTGWSLAERERERVDLLWASPPCDEFARESMPWSKTGTPPDMCCVEAAIRIVNEVQPIYWCIENVRGALPWLRPLLGPPARRIGSVYLWGQFPFFLASPSYHKMRWHGRDAAGRLRRARIPEQISYGLCVAIEEELRDEAETA